MQHKINSLSFSFISILFITVFSSFSISLLFSFDTTSEIIFSLFIGLVIGFFCLNIFFYFFYQEDDNIFCLITSNFSKIISFLWISIVLILSFFIARFLFFEFSIFIKDNMSFELPLLFISTLFLISSYFLVKEGINAIIVSGIIFFFCILLFTFISFLLSVPNIQTENLYPIVWNNLSLSPIFFSFLLSFVPIFFLLVVGKEKVRNNNLYREYQKKAYIFTSIFLIFKILFIIAILGIPYIKILEYPTVHILKKISILNFIERVDEFFLLSSFLSIYFVFTFIIYYIKEGICSIFRIRKESVLLLGIYSIFFLCSFFLEKQSSFFLFFSFSFIFILHLFLFISLKLKKTFS